MILSKGWRIDREECPGYARYDKTASPSFSYLTDASYEAMDFVRQLREKGRILLLLLWMLVPMSRSSCLEEKTWEHLSEILCQRYQQLFQNKGFEPR